MLTQVLAAQVGPHGIRVNCIAPETILTDRNNTMIPDTQKAELVEEHPIRRLGSPEDIAGAAIYLDLGRGRVGHGDHPGRSWRGHHALAATTARAPCTQGNW